jgi:acyl-[acyl carrier protein]--UDP-N-acetylglucosamine O-acyltransferase
VRISAFCTVDAGLVEPTRIGRDSFLMARTHIGHDAVIGERCELGAGTVICGHVVIEDDVQIGGNTWVKPKVRIGKGARLGGGSVVVKDVPAGEVWAGNPAKPLRKGREFLSRQGRVIPIPPLV